MIRKLAAWLDHRLFKLLSPEMYLQLHGVKHYTEPPTTVTVTYILHGEEKQHRVTFGGAWAVVQMIPMWLGWGFVEPEGEERYFVPRRDIHRLEWYDPILEDCFVINTESWPERWDWSVGQRGHVLPRGMPDGPRPQIGTGR